MVALIYTEEENLTQQLILSTPPNDVSPDRLALCQW